MRKIRVKVPCSSANLGSGFDVFGLALEAFHDTLTAELTDKGIVIKVTGLGAEGIPTDLDRNTAGLVAKILVPDHEVGVKLLVEKGVPLKMGLGSSGASAAACAVALNELLSLRLSKNEIVKTAAMGEVAAAGASHADNVAASVLGGFTMIQTWDEELVAVRMEPPPTLEVALALPCIETPENKTAKARALLPRSVGFREAVANARNAVSLVVGFHLGDVEMIGRGMTDLIVEPARKRLIPGFDTVKNVALKAGAAGVAISGAGPGVIAIVDSTKSSTANLASAMKEAFESEGIQCEACCTKPSFSGVVKI
jgi:homoserine kinase